MRQGVLQEWVDRLVASDPGLNRFRMAANGAVAMATVIWVEYFVGRATGAGPKGTLIAMLLGAVVVMMGTMGLVGSAREKAVMTVFFPVAVGTGMVLGTAVAGRRDLLLGVFVAVMFAAVYVRRFGMPFFIYGFMGWMGYFFASFLGASFTTLPALLEYVAVASAWVLLLSTTVLRERPEKVLARTLDSFGARARAVAAAAGAMLDDGGRGLWPRRLRRRQVRMLEAALMVEGQLGDSRALPAGWSPLDLRRWLLDAQLAAERIALAASALVTLPCPPDMLAAAGRVAVAVADGGAAAVDAAAGALTDLSAGDGDLDDRARAEARQMAGAARDYAASAGHWSGGCDVAPGRDGREDGGIEPALTLMLGNLPGSAAVAQNVAPRAGRWNPLRRASLTTRQAVQVAVAGGLAILAGHALSPVRYYWAVIAAFVMFSGTATRAETLIKGFNRVLGTLAGLGAAIWLAELTAGDTAAVLAVILLCMFLGFYLLRVSYALMIFFITIMVAQLYSVLHEFTGGLLVLRLEETALGAVIGIVVALVFVPVSTKDTARAARAAYYQAFTRFLEGAAGLLDGDAGSFDLGAAVRDIDARYQQLDLVLRPLTRVSPFGTDPGLVRHRLTLFMGCATYARELGAALGGGAAPAPRLGMVCRQLAAATASLGEGDRGGEASATAAEHLLAAEDGLCRTAGAGADIDLAEHAVGRLAQGLFLLAEAVPPTTPQPETRAGAFTLAAAAREGA